MRCIGERVRNGHFPSARGLGARVSWLLLAGLRSCTWNVLNDEWPRPGVPANVSVRVCACVRVYVCVYKPVKYCF